MNLGTLMSPEAISPSTNPDQKEDFSLSLSPSDENSQKDQVFNTSTKKWEELPFGIPSEVLLRSHGTDVVYMTNSDPGKRFQDFPGWQLWMW